MSCDSDIVFSSGNRLANKGAGDCMIGIGRDLRIGSGYDHAISTEQILHPEYWCMTPEEVGVAPADMVELADIMIERWKAFRTQWVTVSASSTEQPAAAGAAEVSERCHTITLTPGAGAFDIPPGTIVELSDGTRAVMVAAESHATYVIQTLHTPWYRRMWLRIRPTSAFWRGFWWLD